MLFDPAFPRDIFVIAAVFGAAALIWAGWAQEKPPAIVWRIVLGALSFAGLALVALSIPSIIRAWGSGTAIEPGTPSFVGYVVWFWAEVLAAGVGAILLIRRKRSELIAPLILLIVGLHFLPLAFVFGQGILMLAAVLLSAAAIGAFALRERAAPSFWCGIFASPVLALLGLWALLAGHAAG